MEQHSVLEILKDEFFKAARAEKEEQKRKRKEDWEANKQPLMQALAEDLGAVFRKHGLYLKIRYKDLYLIEGPIAIAIDDSGNISIAEDDGNVSTHSECELVHRLPAPSAHDKMAVKALQARLLGAAKGGAK